MIVLRADPGYRRRLLALMGVCVVIGSGAILLGQPLVDHRVDEYVKAGDFSGAIRFLQIVGAMLLLPTVPMTYSLYRFGQRIRRSSQFPPPGTRVLRDTVVLEGDRARRRGQVAMTASLVLSVIVVIAILCLLRIPPAWWLSPA